MHSQGIWLILWIETTCYLHGLSTVNVMAVMVTHSLSHLMTATNRVLTTSLYLLTSITALRQQALLIPRLCHDVGHCPIILQVDWSLDITETERTTNNHLDSIAWHKVDNYEEYKETIENILSNCPSINVLSSLQCKDRFCQDDHHQAEIDQLCVLLSDVCISAANLTLPKARNNKPIPGWNDKLWPLKHIADFWSAIWRQNGKPDVGLVADIFRKTRRDYHYAVRAQKLQAELTSKEKLAVCLADKNSRDLWKEIKKIKPQH